MDDSGREAFRSYVAARSTALLRTAYLLTGNRADAEDLLQTALAKTYLSWDRIRDQRVARRLRPADHGQHADQLLASLRPETRTAPSPIRASRTHHPQRLARRAVERVGDLPGRQRAVVVLRYYEDLTEARDRRGPRHLHRHRQVHDLPSARASCVTTAACATTHEPPFPMEH